MSASTRTRSISMRRTTSRSRTPRAQVAGEPSCAAPSQSYSALACPWRALSWRSGAICRAAPGSPPRRRSRWRSASLARAERHACEQCRRAARRQRHRPPRPRAPVLAHRELLGGRAHGSARSARRLYGEPQTALRIDFLTLTVEPVPLRLPQGLATGDARHRTAPRQRRLRLQRAPRRVLAGLRAAGRALAAPRRPARLWPSCTSRCAAAPGTCSARTAASRKPSRRCAPKIPSPWARSSMPPTRACAMTTRSPRWPSRAPWSACSKQAPPARASSAAASAGTSSACSPPGATAPPEAPEVSAGPGAHLAAQVLSGVGPATGTAPAMISSISPSSSRESSTASAPRLSSMCSIEREPTIATCTAGFASVQAIASCPTL